MLTNYFSAKNAAKFCLPVAASVLLFSTGCGRDHNNSCNACTTCSSDMSLHQHNAAPVEQLPTYSTLHQEPQYSPPALNVGQLAPQPDIAGGLRGPRSQAEMDAIYSQSQIQSLPAMPERTPLDLTPLPPVANCPTGGDPSWNAPMSRQWRHIVVHHSASPTGSASSFDKAHRAKGWDGLGYHFVIGNGTGTGDGQIEVGYRWTKQQAGAHAGNFEYNQHGVGICLVGDFEKNGPPSPRQMASLRQVIGFLQGRSKIASCNVIGHGNVPGRNTECPGRNLDMNALRASLGGTYSQNVQMPVNAVAAAPVVAAAPTAVAMPEVSSTEKQTTVLAVSVSTTTTKR